MNRSFFKIKKERTEGFTLIELLIVIAMMTVITGILVFNQVGFNEKIALMNEAKNLESYVRQAQHFAMAVKKPPEETRFDVGYGVHFDFEKKGSYRLYWFEKEKKEDDVQYKYDDSRMVEEVKLREGNFIKEVGRLEAGQTWNSGNNNWLVAFERPNQEALFFSYSTGGPEPREGIKIVLSSSSGKYEIEVILEESGQISITEI